MSLRLTVIGSGDAFGAGGRFNTCFRLETQASAFMVDCGATTLVALRKMGIDTTTLDGVVLSHLHGDHFGGLPFLFLEMQYVARRQKPFTVVGPPGTGTRVAALIECMYPGASATALRFEWRIVEMSPGKPVSLFGASLESFAVEHPSGAPATAIRVAAGGRVFGYSGDTQWTDALIEASAGADLFICECYGARAGVPWHLDWPTLAAKRHLMSARRLMLTHMNDEVLALGAAIRAAGCEIAEDGLITDV
jgi:ribonuclease BN (tRNA processing enzyme)